MADFFTLIDCERLEHGMEIMTDPQLYPCYYEVEKRVVERSTPYITLNCDEPISQLELEEVEVLFGLAYRENPKRIASRKLFLTRAHAQDAIPYTTSKMDDIVVIELPIYSEKRESERKGAELSRNVFTFIFVLLFIVWIASYLIKLLPGR